MRRAALTALLLVSGSMVPAPVVAAETNWLRGVCADGDLYYAFGACAGYLMAVAEAGGATYCLPDDVDYLTISLAAQEALAGLPALADETSAATASRVLATLYPC